METSVNIFWLPNSIETCHTVKLIKRPHSALTAAEGHALMCMQLSNAFLASSVGYVMCIDCKYLQPACTTTASMPSISCVVGSVDIVSVTDLALWVCAKLL